MVAPAISQHFAALVAGGERFERRDGSIEVHTGFERDSESGHGIVRIVRAEQMKGECRLRVHRRGNARGGRQASSSTARICGSAHGPIAEVDHLARKIAAELRDVGIGAVEKRNAVGGQRGDQFIFRAGDAGLAFGEVLDVRGADVGHDAPVGRGDAREGSDLAEVVHAHFDDGVFVLGLEAQQLQRQAEGVVQIALRLEHVELRAERGGDGFLGRGLAGRTGNGDDALAPLAAHMRGQGLQRDERIVGDEQRNGERGVGQRGHAGARDHGGDGAALQRRRRQNRVRRIALRARRRTARRARRCASRSSSREPASAPAIGHAGGRLEHRACADRRLCEGELHCPSP